MILKPISTYPPIIKVKQGNKWIEIELPELRIDINKIPEHVNIKYAIVEEDGWVKCKLYAEDHICIDSNLLFQINRNV
jgi:hypothetical protein